MFVLMVLLYGMIFKKDERLMGFIGQKIISILPLKITLSANLRKQINTSSIGLDFLSQSKAYIEDWVAHATVGLSILLSWLIHMGFRDVYFIIFLGIAIALRPYFLMHKVYTSNVSMIDRKLPVLLSQMILLIGAGMSTVNALEKVTIKEDDLLSQQLYRVTQEVKLGGSFEKRLMVFMSQCQQIHITRFGRILLSHERNGTDASKRLLQELIEDLWKNRRSNALKKGEEASTKLLMPMAIALIGILFIISIPAVYEIFTLT